MYRVKLQNVLLIIEIQFKKHTVTRLFETVNIKVHVDVRGDISGSVTYNLYELGQIP